ncbi:MAG: class I SAM-dependent methyltransferase [Oscillospiraceae bacterium]
MSSYHKFAQFYDKLTDNVDYKKRAEYFNKIINLHPNDGKILVDLGCGTGSMCEEFAKLGFDVIGVDNSCEMLNCAMDKKFLSGSDIMYLCQSIDKLDLYGTIDVAISTLDTLNHITDKKVLQEVFNKVSLFLNAGGLFLFDVNTLYKHENILADNAFVYDYDEVFCVWQNNVQNEGIVEISLDFFCTNEDKTYSRYSENFKERAYSHKQILKMIDVAGLKLLNVYDDDSFFPPSETSQRLVYVTTKE